MTPRQRDRWLFARNATIYTMDPARPRAQALLARNGRVMAVGADDALAREAAGLPDIERLDLGGHCVLPGLIDSHIHFLEWGLNLSRVALSGVSSFDEVLRRVAAAASEAAPDAWVQGWGWDHSLWDVPRFPDKSSLDRVAPDVPVVLRRKDGHMTWLNSAALAAAGITRDTADPPGGRIGRDASGEPDGLLFEMANDLVFRAVPPVSPDEATRAARQAIAEAHRLGLTGVHVPESGRSLNTLLRLDAEDALPLRVTMMLTASGLDAVLETGLRTGFGNRRLRLGPVKIFADGSLGAETAAMLEPFEGSSENRGLLLVEPEALAATIEHAARGGLACAVHAIGDRANRVALDAFARTRDDWLPLGLRQRIEHVQVLHPDDLPRLAEIGVIASVQPIHATQDMDLVDRLWGARGRYAYAFRSLLARGTRLAFGSDAPVETADPLAGLYAAVSRRRPDGRPEGGWYPEERLDNASAVRAYTTGAAYAAGAERDLGSLTPGKRADFVVLSEDVMRGPPERLRRARVLHTIFDGRVVSSA